MKNKYWDLFSTFFLLGLLTFGGGYAMISLIKEKVADKKGWMTEEEINDIIVIAESTPGPIAINLATYCGYKIKGVFGSVLATLGVVLPSLIIIFSISLFFDKFIQNKVVAAIFMGIKCAVVYLITTAGIRMFRKMKKTWYSVTATILIILIMAVLSIFSKSFSTIYFILIGGFLGLIIFGFLAKKEPKK
ncbi:MAG: chromate transporter [Clostridiales bacterium]|nr:chromate transporter [Clostridiales bacterium]